MLPRQPPIFGYNDPRPEIMNRFQRPAVIIARMILFAIVVALLLGQVRPLPPGNLVHAGYSAWAVSVRRHFDTGRAGHGWLALLLAVGVPAALVLGTDALLRHWAWPLHIVWQVALLYATLGLGQVSQCLTRIRAALEDDNAADGGESAAAQELAQWQHGQHDEAQRVLARGPVLVQALRHALLAAHRQVFGVLFWFVALALLGLGPLGAVLYRMAAHLGRLQAPASALRHAARRFWYFVDWLPARATALLFAVVGNFEDALEGWRFYAARFANAGGGMHDGVVLAAAAGALRLRLDDEESGDADDNSAAAATPQAGHLRSVAALIWRAMVVCLLLLVLMSLARLTG